MVPETGRVDVAGGLDGFQYHGGGEVLRDDLGADQAAQRKRCRSILLGMIGDADRADVPFHGESIRENRQLLQIFGEHS